MSDYVIERDRPMRFDRHMSDAEALMWTVEKDPMLSSWFATVTILDRPPDAGAFRAKIQKAVVEIPRLRQRVTATLGRWSPPLWTDDPDFDLDYHVRRVAVPSPGDQRALFDLATQLVMDPFDRSRPLWMFWLVEGLEGGRAAMIQKMHHTITDGEGGVRLSEKFIDLSREVTPFEPPPIPDPQPAPDDLRSAVEEALGHNLRRTLGIALRAGAGVIRDPAGSARNVTAVLREIASLTSGEADGAKVGSELWKRRTLHRRLEGIRVPFDPAKRASKELGGTLNDFFVAGAVVGAARYHRERGVEPGRFRVAMPVSYREDGSAGGNAFALTAHVLPGLEDPVKAFEAVHEALRVVKTGGSVDVIGALAGVLNLLPTSVLTRFARAQAANVDFTTSNVRAAPFELYIAGAKIEANYPMGPLAGTAFNLTLLSYAGSLDMGLFVDSGAVDDPPLLRDLIEGAYGDLIAAGT